MASVRQVVSSRVTQAGGARMFFEGSLVSVGKTLQDDEENPVFGSVRSGGEVGALLPH